MYDKRTRSRGPRDNRFASLPSANIPRSVFDITQRVRTTINNGGELVPIWVDEALPGDTFKFTPNMFARLTTPLHPIMDTLHLDAFFFAVPNRLIYDEWEKLMGAQDNPGDHTDYEVPQMVSPVGGYLTHSLSDHLGIPILEAGLSHSSMWHRAYNFIWNEWFRDENIQDSVVVDTDEGPDDPADYVILKRGKRKDYLTSALPWPQKGDAVELPLLQAGQAFDVVPATNPVPTYEGQTSGTQGVLNIGVAGNDVAAHFDDTITTGPWSFGEDVGFLSSGLEVDVTAGSAATINELRTAFQMQKLLERDARGGTRYTEMIQSHFNVTSPDFRLQRPEILGTFSTQLEQQVVPQTAALLAGQEVGEVGAYGTFGHSGRGWMKSFTEHCTLIGMVAVRAPITYQQGLHRRFSRKSKYDFFFPSLAHLGEQSILNKEIYVDVAGGTDDDVFGYQERFAEYRYGQNMVTGQLRSTAAVPLDPWHMALEFTALPTLSPEFIEDDPPINRVVALSSETDDQPNLLFDAVWQVACIRPMPTYGVPGLIDHF